MHQDGRVRPDDDQVPGQNCTAKNFTTKSGLRFEGWGGLSHSSCVKSDLSPHLDASFSLSKVKSRGVQNRFRL